MNSTKMPVIENIELMTARVPLPEGPWGDQIHHVTDIEVAIVDVYGSTSAPALATLPAGAGKPSLR